jgi:hypothetical protein
MLVKLKSLVELIEAALQSANAQESLIAVARQLQQQGVTQENMTGQPTYVADHRALGRGSVFVVRQLWEVSHNLNGGEASYARMDITGKNVNCAKASILANGLPLISKLRLSRTVCLHAQAAYALKLSW